MWFIFPQLAGLAHSPTAQRYAIKDLNQAKRYLNDPALGARLRECAELMLAIPDRSAFDTLGTPDDLKFGSCMTLFRTAASAQANVELFSKALERFFEGQPDHLTPSARRCGVGADSPAH
jgi:uncharacterized protein (DUF1810 family)